MPAILTRCATGFSRLQIASISVPGAWAIDQTPDGSTLYVGTMVGDIYTIDPAAMSVTGHITSQQIGPNGYDAWKVLPLADGRFALLGDYTDDSGIYYYQSFAIWNRATNAFTEYSNFQEILHNPATASQSVTRFVRIWARSATAAGLSKTSAAAGAIPSLRHFASAAKTAMTAGPAASAANTPAVPRIVPAAAIAQVSQATPAGTPEQQTRSSSASLAPANDKRMPATMPRLLSLAFSTLPANTASLEYDDLATLRHSPQYATLRQTCSSASVQRVQTALAALGVSEQSISQVAMAANSDSFYGLVSGQFSGAALLKAAPKNAVTSISGQPMLCAATQVCMTFVEDSVAAFGTLDQFAAIQQVRERRTLALSSNQKLANFLTQADFTAPVIGVAPGFELNGWITGSAAKALLNQSSVVAALPTVTSFEYSVVLDSHVRVQMMLDMSSVFAANALSAGVNSISAILSAGAKASTSISALPITALHATAIGSQVHLSLAAPIV